jgi:hypothetical protein
MGLPPEPGESPPPPDRPRRRVGLSPALVVEDFRSVRRWLVVLGAIAVVASAVAVFALVRADESESESADKDRVGLLERSLQQRIAEVDRRLGKTPTESETNKIERRLRRTSEETDVARLDRRLRRVEDDLTDAVGGAADAGKGLVRVQRRLDALAREVRRLR